MKKIIAITVLLVGLIGAGAADARWHRGAEQGYDNGRPGYGMQQPMQLMTPEMQEKFRAFQKDTVALRKKVAMKKAETRALLRSDNPDPATVSKLAGELFDLKSSIREKAEAAGLERMRGSRGNGGKMKGSKRWAMMPWKMDAESLDKMDAFREKNSDSFKLLAMKRAEQRALMKADSVSPAKAAALAGEIFDLRTALQEKADEAGVPFHGMMMGREMGHGGKMSGMHRNQQGGGRW